MNEITKSSLIVDGISKSFHGVKATNRVSLTLDFGRSMALIGPNGAGKTTLFNLITGELPLDEGKIFLFGEDVSNASVQRRSELGLSRTYQICNLFKELTVEENLYLSLKNSVWGKSRGLVEWFFSWSSNKIKMERISEILSEIKLEPLRYVQVKNMSHGEQRQLELGMSLISDPKIILFDEPMAGLSPAERVFIGKIIRQLCKEKIILVIEHDIDFALTVTDRVAVLNHGSLIVEGTPAEIQQNIEVQQIYKI
ncbi:MAG: ABC transporter ATP-binding protein [Fusobacteriaceae bacterium]|jgi:branched-chain amino acid transport system ATP-binding protein|nr:ABC transporter ATP-binding protein [Fusobacteriaceae bacterium]